MEGTQKEEIFHKLEILYDDLSYTEEVVQKMIDSISDYESEPTKDVEQSVIKSFNSMAEDIDYIIAQMVRIENMEDSDLYIEMDEFISWLRAYQPLIEHGELAIKPTATYVEQTYTWLERLKSEIEFKGNDLDDIVGIVGNHN